MHCTSKSLLLGAFGPALRRSSSPPLAFLIPSITTPSPPRATFSSTPPSHARKNGNPLRGISALRHTGMRKQILGASRFPVPVPVKTPERRSRVEVDPDHGLYGFFNEAREPLIAPTDLAAHGRAWNVQELRRKDWEDLHKLWWVCAKEKNRIATTQRERTKIGEMYGEYEAEERRKAVCLISLLLMMWSAFWVFRVDDALFNADHTLPYRSKRRSGRSGLCSRSAGIRGRMHAWLLWTIQRSTFMQILTRANELGDPLRWMERRMLCWKIRHITCL